MIQSSKEAFGFEQTFEQIFEQITKPSGITFRIFPISNVR